MVVRSRTLPVTNLPCSKHHHKITARNMTESYTVNVPGGSPITVYYAGGPHSPLPHSVTKKPVRIEDIRKTHAGTGTLFEDHDFPADSGSIGGVGGDWAASSGKAAKSYTWLRPHELCRSAGVKKPDFAAAQDKLQSSQLCSEYDLKQGGLGDCWYLAALAALTERPDQLKFVIPEDNFTGFDEGTYCGAFHFRIYSMYHCKWVDIVVDDRLPAVSKKGIMVPAFTKITTTTCKAADATAEFWPALIEKAYAKFIGSYAKIEGGFTSQALEDFTNGFSEIIDLTQPVEAFKLQSPVITTKYDFMVEKIKKLVKTTNFFGLDTFDLDGAHEHGVLDGYSDFKDSVGGKGVQKLTGYKYNQVKEVVEKDPTTTGKGLCQAHAYTVLTAREFKTKDGKESHFLLKVKNPHATHEWTGQFGDKDDKSWSKMTHDGRAKEHGSKDLDEGIFCIDLHDALRYFSNFEACVFGMSDGTKFCYVQDVWPASIQTRATKFSRSDLHYFTGYKFEAKRELLEIDIPASYGNKCLVAWTIVMAGYYSGMEPELRFSYYLYKVTEADLGRPIAELYKKKSSVIDSGAGNVGREESRWGMLEPGTYVIVPFVKTAPSALKSIPKEYLGKPIPYTLRLFTENATKLEPIPAKL